MEIPGRRNVAGRLKFSNRKSHPFGWLSYLVVTSGRRLLSIVGFKGQAVQFVKINHFFHFLSVSIITQIVLFVNRFFREICGFSKTTLTFRERRPGGTR
jgi:hypothetical protein